MVLPPIRPWVYECSNVPIDRVKNEESLYYDLILSVDFSKPNFSDITHDIIDVIQRLGDVIDPATGKPVVADRYRSEIERTSKLYGESKSTLSRYEDRLWYVLFKYWQETKLLAQISKAIIGFIGNIFSFLWFFFSHTRY